MNTSNLATRMWFARRKGQILGPFLLTDLRKLHDRGSLALFDEVSEDKTIWHTLQSLYDAEKSRQEELASQERSSVTIEPALPIISLPARKKGLSKLMWAGIGVMVLLSLASSVLLAYYLLNRPSVVTKNTQPFSLPYVTSVKQEDKLAESVGLVVCGYQIVKDTKHFEFPESTGSCFAVSSNGYLVTNKHVINEFWKSKNQPLKVDQIRKLFGVDIVRPVIWVFFGKEKLVAELVHVSDLYDIAVLKTNRHDSTYLRLGNGDQLPRGTRVYAVGFPATSRIEVDKGEEQELQARLKKSIESGHVTIESQFKPRDFEFILTDGTVSRVTKTAGDNVSAWVQHTASINSGNSGGPLMLENGTVIGVNTLVAAKAGIVDGSAFFSITLPQLRKEIESHARNIAWE